MADFGKQAGNVYAQTKVGFMGLRGSAKIGVGVVVVLAFILGAIVF